jgi:hypothetical protein
VICFFSWEASKLPSWKRKKARFFCTLAMSPSHWSTSSCQLYVRSSCELSSESLMSGEMTHWADGFASEIVSSEFPTVMMPSVVEWTTPHTSTCFRPVWAVKPK